MAPKPRLPQYANGSIYIWSLVSTTVGRHHASRVLEKRDDISVGVADMEVEATPGLLGEALGNIHSPCLVFLKERLHISHFDHHQDEGAFAFGELHEVGLMHEAQMQARAAA